MNKLISVICVIWALAAHLVGHIALLEAVDLYDLSIGFFLLTQGVALFIVGAWCAYLNTEV